MKSVNILFIVLLAGLVASAQTFPGIRSGNYNGVSGIMFNPASIADSRSRFDFNLVSVHVNASNDKADFRLSDFSADFNSDSLADIFIGNDAGTSSGFFQTELMGPSFMFNTGKNSAVAISTRLRGIANVIDLDGQLVSSVTGDDADMNSFPFQLNSSNNMRMAANSWAEIGLTYARTIYNKGPHFIKAGVTGKYLLGISNGFVNLNSLRGTIDEDGINGDAYLSDASGHIGIGSQGASLKDFDPAEILDGGARGIGVDIGFVYEFRPDHEKYTPEKPGKDENKYKFSVSASLMDLGRIKNSADAEQGLYDLHINGSERLYFSDLDGLDFAGYRNYFNSHPGYFTPTQVNGEDYFRLPTSLQLAVDYRIGKSFYINASAQLPVQSDDVTQAYSNRLYRSFSFTPRVEAKRFGLYLPFQYHALAGFNGGAAIRLGPLFVGSGSILSAAFAKSKQLDVFAGLKLSFWR